LNALIISHLWPRADIPHLGIFVADQVAELAKHDAVCVMAPVDLTHRTEEIGLREILAGLPKYRARSRPNLLPAGSITPQIIPFRAAPFRQALALASAQNLAAALKRIDLSGFDLVHAHTLFPDGLAAALWLQDKSLPLVVTAHGSDAHSMPAGVKKALPVLLARANGLIAVSQALADILTALGANPTKISVLPNGFAADQFALLHLPDRNSQKIVFLGRLGAVKRADLLIRAMRHIPDRIKLEIAGDGAEKAKLEELVSERGLGRRVTFLGQISRTQVPEFLAGAALLCIVSRMEGWPTVIFESLACGTPILATAVGGIPEALADDRLGVLVSSQISPAQLAEQIQTALEKRWDHTFIRESVQQYSWQAIVSRLRDLYARYSRS
jgi:glycosyltransferase involved in cell wall biosynthesis